MVQPLEGGDSEKHKKQLQMLKRGEVKTRDIEIWDDESVLKLQGCFDCTELVSVFIDSASDIDELVDFVCYISFCVCYSQKACKSVCK